MTLAGSDLRRGDRVRVDGRGMYVIVRPLGRAGRDGLIPFAAYSPGGKQVRLRLAADHCWPAERPAAPKPVTPHPATARQEAANRRSGR